jgi:hypothetical protein
MRWYRCLTQKQQLAVCLTTVLLSLAACEASEPEQTAPPDEVTFLTGAGFIAAQGYGFVADAKGFFAEENLKVSVKPGQAGEANMQLVRAGEAQFAAIEYSGAIQRAAVGQFDGVHCIAVLNEKTTNALMALASSGIRTARDLPGKTVAVIPGSAPKLLWPAYAGLVTPRMSDQEIRSAGDLVAHLRRPAAAALHPGPADPGRRGRDRHRHRPGRPATTPRPPRTCTSRPAPRPADPAQHLPMDTVNTASHPTTTAVTE